MSAVRIRVLLRPERGDGSIAAENLIGYHEEALSAALARVAGVWDGNARAVLAVELRPAGEPVQGLDVLLAPGVDVSEVVWRIVDATDRWLDRSAP